MRIPFSAAVLLAGTAALSASAQVQQLPPGTTLPTDNSTAAPVSSALQAAEARMAAQDWAGALTLLMPLTNRANPSPRALYDLAFCRDAQDDTSGAKVAYERAIAADPANALPLVGLGLLLARSGDAAGAASALQHAVALPADNNPDAVRARAQAYRALARLVLPTAPDQSRDDLLAALRLSAETPDDIQLAGEIAEALQDDAAAATAYARLQQAAPTDPRTALQYARVLARLARTAEASPVVELALAAHPTDADLLAEKANLLLAARQFAQAIPLLQQLHAARPDDAVVARLLARALVAVNQLAPADALLRELVARNPSDPENLVDLADCLMRQHRSPDAEPLLEHALQLKFSRPAERADAALALAFAASADAHPEAVVRAIAIRNETLPMSAPAAFLLASAHDTLHHSREAAGAYRQFMELANGQYPDEEVQATERLRVLSRAK